MGNQRIWASAQDWGNNGLIKYLSPLLPGVVSTKLVGFSCFSDGLHPPLLPKHDPVLLREPISAPSLACTLLPRAEGAGSRQCT